MTKPLLKVDASALEEIWPLVAGRISDLEQGQPWGLQHVASALDSGAAELWVTGSVDGFVVVTVINEPWQRFLFVWLACNAVEGSAGRYLPQIKDIARRHGCEVVQFVSKRKGYQRVMPNADVSYLYNIGVSQ